MDIQELKVLLEEMWKNGRIENTCINAYVGEILQTDRVERLYRILDKNNFLIILQAIAKQCIISKAKYNLKFDTLEEVVYDKSLQKYECIKCIKVFMACAKEDELSTFVKIIDLAHKYELLL